MEVEQAASPLASISEMFERRLGFEGEQNTTMKATKAEVSERWSRFLPDFLVFRTQPHLCRREGIASKAIIRELTDAGCRSCPRNLKRRVTEHEANAWRPCVQHEAPPPSIYPNQTMPSTRAVGAMYNAAMHGCLSMVH